MADGFMNKSFSFRFRFVSFDWALSGAALFVSFPRWDWAWPSTIPGERVIRARLIHARPRGFFLEPPVDPPPLLDRLWVGAVRLSAYLLLCGLIACWFLSLLLICIHGLHNPGLTRLAVLPIHGRPRSMFPGSFADSAFFLVEVLH